VAVFSVLRLNQKTQNALKRGCSNKVPDNALKRGCSNKVPDKTEGRTVGSGFALSATNRSSGVLVVGRVRTGTGTE